MVVDTDAAQKRAPPAAATVVAAAAAATVAAAAAGLAEAESVGALLTPARAAGSVIAMIRECGWRRRGRSVCPYTPGLPGAAEVEAGLRLPGGDVGWVAVHVTAAAAGVLGRVRGRRRGGGGGEAEEVLPHPIAEALADGRVYWLPGVRIGSVGCGGPRGRQCNAAFHALRNVASDAGPGARGRVRARGKAGHVVAFRFVELFAGIGGFRIALEALGGRCVFASELDEYACTTYHATFGEVLHSLFCGPQSAGFSRPGGCVADTRLHNAQLQGCARVW
jgi:hypothetical protein